MSLYEYTLGLDTMQKCSHTIKSYVGRCCKRFNQKMLFSFLFTKLPKKLGKNVFPFLFKSHVHQMAAQTCPRHLPIIKTTGRLRHARTEVGKTKRRKGA